MLMMIIMVQHQDGGVTHFSKIQDGVDAVDDGGTVYVNPGEYREQVIVNKNLNLIGVVENLDKPIIKKPNIFNIFKIPEQTVVVQNNFWEPLIFAFGGSVDASGNISGSDTIDFNISNFIID